MVQQNMPLGEVSPIVEAQRKNKTFGHPGMVNISEPPRIIGRTWCPPLDAQTALHCLSQISEDLTLYVDYEYEVP